MHVNVQYMHTLYRLTSSHYANASPIQCTLVLSWNRRETNKETTRFIGAFERKSIILIEFRCTTTHTNKHIAHSRSFSHNYAYIKHNKSLSSIYSFQLHLNKFKYDNFIIIFSIYDCVLLEYYGKTKTMSSSVLNSIRCQCASRSAFSGTSTEPSRTTVF